MICSIVCIAGTKIHTQAFQGKCHAHWSDVVTQLQQNTEWHC